MLLWLLLVATPRSWVIFFFLMNRPPPTSTLFPYTPLFRSREILDRLADAYRRIRNTFRFLLGNLSDFDPARDRQSSARLDEVDRWILDESRGRLAIARRRSGEHTSELQSPCNLVCRLLL